MDFGVLLPSELMNISRFYNFYGDIPQIINQLRTVKFIPGRLTPHELIDLYVANYIVQNNIEIDIPDDLKNMTDCEIKSMIQDINNKLQTVYLEVSSDIQTKNRLIRLINIIKSEKDQRVQTKVVSSEVPILNPIKSQLSTLKTVSTIPEVSDSDILLSTTPTPVVYPLSNQNIQHTNKNLSTQKSKISKPSSRSSFNSNSGVKVYPTKYVGRGEIGDLEWMIERPEYDDSLFLFMNTEEQYILFANFINGDDLGNDICDTEGLEKYQCVNPPKAVGIPVGSEKGHYRTIKAAAPYVESALTFIRELLKSGIYKRVFYNVGEDFLITGSQIPSLSVRKYITTQINKL